MNNDSFVADGSLSAVQLAPSASRTVPSLLGDGGGDPREDLITLPGLVIRIAKLREESETDPNGISNQVLQRLPKSCRPWHLAKLNHICVTGVIPDDW